MVSPEVLRRYSFFAIFENDSLREVAMITEEIELAAGEVVFEFNDPADNLYLLMSGNVHLHYIVADEHDPNIRKDFLVGTINPGELLGISAVIEPHILTATAVSASASKILQIDAKGLRSLGEAKPKLGCSLCLEIAKTAKTRLEATRVLLAAASAPEFN